MCLAQGMCFINVSVIVLGYEGRSSYWPGGPGQRQSLRLALSCPFSRAGTPLAHSNQRADMEL